MEANFKILKSSGERVAFSPEKLRNSLLRSGATDNTVDKIISIVSKELYQDITTREIYNRAFSLLKKEKPVFASRYKLKKAIYELGPTGFPFERFISAMLSYSGYDTLVGNILPGKCVSHEVDIMAKKKGRHIMAECKFHSSEGIKCDVKIPLYIHSRFQDILNFNSKLKGDSSGEYEGWVVTNTRFTSDALEFGICVGMYLLSWNYPEGDSLKERIDRLGLYPITVSTLLSQREKQFLLSRDIVLCRELINDSFYLDQLGVSNGRKSRILDEVDLLCNLNR